MSAAARGHSRAAVNGRDETEALALVKSMNAALGEFDALVTSILDSPKPVA